MIEEKEEIFETVADFEEKYGKIVARQFFNGKHYIFTADSVHISKTDLFPL